MYIFIGDGNNIILPKKEEIQKNTTTTKKEIQQKFLPIDLFFHVIY